MNKITFPIGYYPDPTKSLALASGELYIGDVDTDPEIPANQVTVTALQEDNTQVSMSQPITLSPGGVPLYLGSPVSLFVTSDYSMKVLDSDGTQVFYIPSSSLTDSEELRVFETISDLLDSAATGLVAVNVLGYHDAGDGGGDTFIWNATGDKADHNGGTIIDPDITFPTDWTNQAQVTTWFTAGAGTGTWDRESDGTLNVKKFGAKGDNSEDDTQSIQIALDMVAYVDDNIGAPVVYFPTGIYLISSMLTFTNSGSRCRIYGDGMVASIIKATASMDYVMKVGTAVIEPTLMEIDRLTFHGDFNATAGMYFYGSSSTISRCRFYRYTADNYGLTIGKWVNRILNCSFNGGDVSGNPSSNGIYIPVEVINDVQIKECSFYNHDIGIKVDAAPHDLKIHYNSMDVCHATAIFLAGGGNHISIMHNYIEACGTDNVGEGVDIVDYPVTGTANYSAAIVASWNAAGATTYFEELNITDNLFATCAGGSLGVISGLNGLLWKDNGALPNITYDYVVRFVEKGIGEVNGIASGVQVEQRDYTSMFTELVELSDYPSTTAARNSGMHLVWQKEDAQYLTHDFYDVIPNDLTDSKWTVNAGSVTQTGTMEASDIFVFAAGGDISLEVTVDTSRSGWRGRYFRISMLTKGTGAVSNGVTTKVHVDIGAGYVEVLRGYRKSLDVWETNSQNGVFYVPVTATKVKVEMVHIVSGTDAYVTQFHVDSAAAPPRR